MVRRLRRRLLRAVGRLERPAAWCLLIGAFCTLAGVVLRLVTLGNATLATVLIAAGLLVDGWGELKDAYEDDDDLQAGQDDAGP